MNDKRVGDLLKEASHPLVSLEFFPPKDCFGFGLLGGSMERMRSVEPAFVSVTYGAGGSTRTRTLEACRLLRRFGFGPVVAHLTCIRSSRAELESIIHDYYDRGFRNIMCLRGDPPADAPAEETSPPDELQHADDLVRLVKSLHPDMCCGVAGYPEKHPEAPDFETDLKYLKQKVDAGACFITTQMFFDNAPYFRFVERCRAAGIHVPVLPGLMPVISQRQIERMLSLSCAELPSVLARAVQEAGGEGAAVEAIGMNWAVKQIEGLLAGGAPGVHLYVLNRVNTVTSPLLARTLAKWR